MEKQDIPEGATHERDGYYYKVASTVQYMDHGEWVDCQDPRDFVGWLCELTPLKVKAP